jgi:glyoxylase-like metal-dependent hydrolase (beta-lactamase superfamily II)
MVKLSERVARLRAPNPSPMTLDGTNSYVIVTGPGESVVIDPGPAIDAHVVSLMTTAQDLGTRIVSILVTHGHPDHAPGAAALSKLVDAPVLAHPNAEFAHDQDVAGETQLSYVDATIGVVEAPGHSVDHLVFYLREEKALFTGDVVLGVGTVVIAPPGGSMRVYQRTLERLLHDYSDAARIYGGHGPAVDDPRAKLVEYIEHRKERERQLVAQLRTGPATIPQIVRRVYADVDPGLWRAAARQMLAYLEALEREGRVRGVAPKSVSEDDRAMLTRFGGDGADPVREYVLLPG